jgi:hypothetical protein
MSEEELSRVLSELSISLKQLERLVDSKLMPLRKEILQEWENTAEYKSIIECKNILERYEKQKTEFEALWGKETYDFVYDVFGQLKCREYLEWLQSGKPTRRVGKEKKAKKENPQKSEKAPFSEAEKIWLKKFYRSLAKEYHPDIHGDHEAMILINRLKDDWEI